jgi:hypothetical protein|nr:MAG TPA: hypothetical protein [Caudoviricetes sp.]
MERKDFFLKKAFVKAEMNGKKVFKKDLAAKLWPKGTPSSQQVNMTKLLSGRICYISPEWVKIICEELECTADFLFGLSDE